MVLFSTVHHQKQMACVGNESSVEQCTHLCPIPPEGLRDTVSYLCPYLLSST